MINSKYITVVGILGFVFTFRNCIYLHFLCSKLGYYCYRRWRGNSSPMYCHSLLSKGRNLQFFMNTKIAYNTSGVFLINKVSRKFL